MEKFLQGFLKLFFCVEKENPGQKTWVINSQAVLGN
jgi:hypothetical protein